MNKWLGRLLWPNDCMRRLLAAVLALLVVCGPSQQFKPASDPDEDIDFAVRQGVRRNADCSVIARWITRDIAFTTGDGRLDQLIFTRQMRVHAFGLPRNPVVLFTQSWIEEATLVLWRMPKWDGAFGPGFIGVARWRGVNYYLMGELRIYGSF